MSTEMVVTCPLETGPSEESDLRLRKASIVRGETTLQVGAGSDIDIGTIIGGGRSLVGQAMIIQRCPRGAKD